MSIAYTLYIQINLLYHPMIDFFQIKTIHIQKIETSLMHTLYNVRTIKAYIFIRFTH